MTNQVLLMMEEESDDEKCSVIRWFQDTFQMDFVLGCGRHGLDTWEITRSRTDDRRRRRSDAIPVYQRFPFPPIHTFIYVCPSPDWVDDSLEKMLRLCSPSAGIMKNVIVQRIIPGSVLEWLNHRQPNVLRNFVLIEPTASMDNLPPPLRTPTNLDGALKQMYPNLQTTIFDPKITGYRQARIVQDYLTRKFLAERT